MELTDREAQEVNESLYLAYWDTLDQAVAAAYLFRAIYCDGYPPVGVYPWSKGQYRIKWVKHAYPSDGEPLAIIDGPPSYPPTPKPEPKPEPSIERELKELRVTIDGLKQRMLKVLDFIDGDLPPTTSPSTNKIT